MKSIQFLKQKGIGLLELMLSLAIIAILLIMATRYYQSASNSQAISQALDMMNAVKSGVKNYMNSNLNSATLPSVATLVTNGYLPASYGSSASVNATANPWGGMICVEAGGSGSSCSAGLGASSYFNVDMTGIPVSICNQLSERLNSTINSSVGEAVNNGCSSGNIGVKYVL